MYLSRPPCSTWLARIPGPRRELLEVGLEVVEIGALDAALGADEAAVHDVIRQADDLEELRAAIARDGRDAHLRHDLEQAFSDTGAVTAPELEAGREIELHPALAHHLEQDLVGHVGIHSRRAVSDETCEMMRVTRRAGLDEKIALTAQAGLHEVMMHGARHEQRVRRQLPLHEVAIGQQQHELTVAHGILRLLAHAQDGALQALIRVVLKVDELVRHLLQGEDLPQLPLRQNRRAQHDLPRMLGRGHEDVALRADLRLQRHHDRLAQRIDRRVRYLRELLAEVVIERAHFVRQHRHGRVVAHGAHRLTLVLREHADDFLALLGARR